MNRPRIANLEEAKKAVLASHLFDNVELWSPDNAAEVQGVLWFVALQRAIQTDFPTRNAKVVLHCGSRGDLAIEAIRLGLTGIALNASPTVTAKVADVAASHGARLYAD